MFSSAVLCGKRLYCWNTIDTSLRSATISASLCSGVHRVRRRRRSRRGRCGTRPLMQRSSVDLPEPDGPMMHTASPLRDRERDAAQHLDRAERLVHVGEPDDRGGCGVIGSIPASARDAAGTSITRGAWPVAARKRSRSACAITIVASLTSGCACTARRVPQRAIDDEFDRAASRSLTSASRLTEPGVIPRCFASRSGDAKPSRPAPSAAPSALRSTARSCGTVTRKWRAPFLSRRNRFFVLAPGSFGTSRSDSSTVITGRMPWRAAAIPCSRRNASSVHQRTAYALRGGGSTARSDSSRRRTTAARSCRSGSAGRCGPRRW